MNTKAVVWAANQDIRSAVAMLVLLHLALRVDSTFTCLLTVRELAKAAASSGQSTVRRALNQLEDAGFITRDSRFDNSGGQRSNRYLVNHPAAPHLSAKAPGAAGVNLELPLDLGGAAPAARRGRRPDRPTLIPKRAGVAAPHTNPTRTTEGRASHV
ncbi:MAG: hypothetical protein FGM52_03075 [Mycobacterium sp.]|nr:hypothetical protein [Mycobacterium sp.]